MLNGWSGVNGVRVEKGNYVEEVMFLNDDIYVSMKKFYNRKMDCDKKTCLCPWKNTQKVRNICPLCTFYHDIVFRCEGHPEAGIETQEHKADAPCKYVKGGYQEEGQMPDGEDQENRGDSNKGYEEETGDQEGNTGQYTEQPDGETAQNEEAQGEEPVQSPNPAEDGETTPEEGSTQEGEPAQGEDPAQDGEDPGQDGEDPAQDEEATEGEEEYEESEGADPVPQKGADRRWRRY